VLLSESQSDLGAEISTHGIIRHGRANRHDWQSLFPFDAHYVDVGDARMHYVDEGHGEPILAVHGNPTWSFYWRNIIARFSSTQRVIAADHIGMGLSDKPAQYDYSLQQHTANLIDLIDQLDLREITLLGHDWGGAIGLNAMTQRPDRFKQFVLFNTGAFPPPTVPRRIAVCRTPFLGRLAVQGLNLFAYAAQSMATQQPGGLSRAARDGMLAPYRSWKNRVGIYRFVADIPMCDKQETWLALEHLEKQLPEFSHLPSMLIWGMRDWCFDGECLRKFEELLPTATVHRLMNAGHWVVEDAADEVETLLRQFLAGGQVQPAMTSRHIVPA
jgi:haloalkane dehalogenase